MRWRGFARDNTTTRVRRTHAPRVFVSHEHLCLSSGRKSYSVGDECLKSSLVYLEDEEDDGGVVGGCGLHWQVLYISGNAYFPSRSLLIRGTVKAIHHRILISPGQARLSLFLYYFPKARTGVHREIYGQKIVRSSKCCRIKRHEI